MKILRIITSGLASGALRMRPELMEVMKKFGKSEQRETGEPDTGNKDIEQHDASEPPVKIEDAKAPPYAEAPPASPPLCAGQPRMVFVSPLPGRWISWSCMVLGCVALWTAHPASTGWFSIQKESNSSIRV
jgi:hypothetical protein